MRIIAGTLKGRRLLAPSGLDIRPTSDKVKGALFNILSNRIEGASLVDLYAGTGSIGIEALSRGAREVIFVENNKRHLQYLKKNLNLAPIHGKAEIFTKPAFTFLKEPRKTPVDFIFADPSYHTEELGKILPRLGEGDMIAEQGVLIVEHFHKKSVPEQIGKIVLLKQYKYGETLLSFYVKK